jgi:hypothetical protein
MELTRQRRAAKKTPRGTGSKKKAAGKGKAKMNEAADKTLAENSAKIAQSLLDNILKKGNVTSAKLLFALADGLVDCEDEGVMKHVFSLAEGLAAEQEWSGDEIDGAAEGCIDGREPES